MNVAAPTILTLETDSAWVVILAVSLATLVVALLLRRLIAKPGGLGSSVLLTLPLVLPLVAAVVYQHGVLPEISVMRPIDPGVLERSDQALLHLVMVADTRPNVFIPYVMTGSTGPYMLLIGLAVSSIMLLRRAFGYAAMRRLVRRCEIAGAEDHGELIAAAARLSRAAGLAERPQILLLPDGATGAFATGGPEPRILVGRDVLEALTHEETSAVLAHEIAHIAARDIPVVFAAGFMRDLVAWNPFAHIAYRRLVTDRELEADRVAASLTHAPLTVASSLVKMCDLMRLRPRSMRYRFAVSFWRPRGGGLQRRVANLLAIADGRIAPAPIRYAPYVAAVCLAAVVGLQAGARVAAEGDGAFAIVLGSADAAPRVNLSRPAMAADVRPDVQRAAKGTRRSMKAAVEPRAGRTFSKRFAMLTRRNSLGIKQVPRFLRAFYAYARGRQLPEPMLWDAVAVFQPGLSVGVYRMQTGTRVAPGAL